MIRPILQRYAAMTTGILLVLMTTGPICNESLPPYDVPPDFLEGEVSATYVLTENENVVRVFLDVTNRYDETLEGPADFSGSIDISLLGNPDLGITFPLSATQLLTPGVYNAGSGVITIDPGETVRFGVTWNLITGNAVDLRDSVFVYWLDPDCPAGGAPATPGPRCIAEEVIFLIEGRVAFFQTTAPAAAGPAMFSLCHVNKYVFGSNCDLIADFIPCSKRAVTAPTGTPCPGDPVPG